MEYGGKEFNDPVLRCDSCSKLVHRKFITVYAGCNHCGNKRFRSINGLSSEEHRTLKDGTYKLNLDNYKIDPDYLNLFEEVEDV